MKGPHSTSRYRFVIEMGLPMQSWRNLELAGLPGILGKHLADELRGIEGIDAEEHFKPLLGLGMDAPLIWPGEQPKDRVETLTSTSPEWLVFIAIPAGIAYAQGARLIIDWLKRLRKRPDRPLDHVTVTLKNKRGDLRLDLTAARIEELEFTLQDEANQDN